MNVNTTSADLRYHLSMSSVLSLDKSILCKNVVVAKPHAQEERQDGTEEQDNRELDGMEVHVCHQATALKWRARTVEHRLGVLALWQRHRAPQALQQQVP